jgi:murein DD-endopeptidase MepM/ murein hydrolase activator NlpD
MADYAYPFSENTDYPHTHWDGALAVDVFGTKGSNIAACTDGWAVVADFSLGGHTVILRGDDGRHYYHAHLVQGSGRGGRVRKGEKIGEMDNTGNAKDRPTHCHWAAASASHGIDENGAGDIPPWTLLDQWYRPPFLADVKDGAEIAKLQARLAELKEQVARERSWGSAIVVHVLIPAVGILDDALRAGAIPPDNINQVLKLLADHGGRP